MCGPICRCGHAGGEKGPCEWDYTKMVNVTCEGVAGQELSDWTNLPTQLSSNIHQRSSTNHVPLALLLSKSYWKAALQYLISLPAYNDPSSYQPPSAGEATPHNFGLGSVMRL
ncbi:hypothetical protein Pelo_5646 [Pelomyxa schiedti]|nr:hypothetical protein Pelo_5646 [Pelomyxa schiedti]